MTLGKGWLIEQLLVVPIVSAVIVSGLYSFLIKWNAPKILYILGIVIVNFSPLYTKCIENFYIMKYTLYALGTILFNLHSTFYILHSTLHTVYAILYTINSAL